LLTDQIIAVSETTADEFAATGICPRDQISIVVSGIDFSRFPMMPFADRNKTRASLGISAEASMIVSVGHLMKDKGYELLLEAAGELRHSWPAAHFVIVGAGPMEKSLRSRIVQMGLETRVHLAGVRHDVPEILASADVFVQTSYREGLSRSLVEALYAKLPAVATDVGGTREVVFDGETGWLVPPGQPSVLAARVAQLLSDSEQRIQMGARAHRLVAEDRTIERMGKSLDTMYRDLASCRLKSTKSSATHQVLDSDPGRRQSRRIVFVINSLHVGGTERHLLRVAPGLCARGWIVSVFCLTRDGDFIEPMESAGIEVLGPRPRNRWTGLPWATLSLLLYLRRRRPVIVHAYLPAACAVGAVAARCARVPTIVTSRREVHSYRGARLALYRILMAVADRCSDCIIAVAEAARLQAEAEGSPREKTVTIYNSVALPPLADTAELPIVGSHVIGTIGSAHKRKGQIFLIEAIPSIVSVFPDARLVIVGEGGGIAKLKSRALELGVAEKVTFLGQRLDVADLLAKFDLFVLPSLREGLPNALIEAMAMGLPVIASNVGGIPEIVRHEDTGLLVAPGSPKALSTAVCRLWQDPALRTNLGLSARDCIVRRFGSVSREVSETESVYLRLISGEHGEPYARGNPG
jgi:glycosyltransferase involved in cell wall biosynthesis